MGRTWWGVDISLSSRINLRGIWGVLRSSLSVNCLSIACQYVELKTNCPSILYICQNGPGNNLFGRSRVNISSWVHPQPAKPPNRSPCSYSTDTKFDNRFLRVELWILYVSLKGWCGISCRNLPSWWIVRAGITNRKFGGGGGGGGGVNVLEPSANFHCLRP